MSSIWIEETVVLAVHDMQLAEHGGLSGVRDEGLLQSALARPRNLEAYGENAGIPALAAAYGFRIACNHPFMDGNKRTALVVTELFIKMNGYILVAGNVACVLAMLGLANGATSEQDFAAWLRANMARAGKEKKTAGDAANGAKEKRGLRNKK